MRYCNGFLMLGIAIMLSGSWQMVFASEGVPTDVLSPGRLVEARVIKAEELKGKVVAVLKIEHDFLGPGPLKGAEFEISANKSGEAILGGIAFLPPLAAGDRVITYVSKEDDSIKWDMAAHLNVTWMRLPARKSDSEEAYETALLWASTVEKVAKTPEEDRAALLRKLGKGESTALSIWAVTVMGESKLPEFEEYLQELVVQEDVNLETKLAADASLGEFSDREWLASEKRVDCLAAWMASVPTDEDALHLLVALNRSIQHKELSMKQYLLLFGGILSNDKLSSERRKAVFSILDTGYRRYENKEDREQVLEFLREFGLLSQDRLLGKEAGDLLDSLNTQ